MRGKFQTDGEGRKCHLGRLKSRMGSRKYWKGSEKDARLRKSEGGRVKGGKVWTEDGEKGGRCFLGRKE
jgi:hypothetical protein